MAGRREHWEQVYRSKRSEKLSWFQPRPDVSLALIELAGCGPSAHIIDVGGGTSHLVDVLLERGYQRLTILDFSSSALNQVKQRVGDLAGQVDWIEADITSASLAQTFDLWHDRAVFHFLTEADDRAAYARVLREALKPGGHAVIATFAEDGPTHCSGLPVVRYSPASLLAELGESFELVETRQQLHRTPAGRDQSFVYCLFRKRSGERHQAS